MLTTALFQKDWWVLGMCFCCHKWMSLRKVLFVVCESLPMLCHSRGRQRLHLISDCKWTGTEFSVELELDWYFTSQLHWTDQG